MRYLMRLNDFFEQEEGIINDWNEFRQSCYFQTNEKLFWIILLFFSF